jgi:hypothetical protein
MKHMPAEYRRDFCTAVGSADVISVRYKLPLSLLFCLFSTLHYSFHICGSSVLLQSRLTGGKKSSSLSTFSGL